MFYVGDDWATDHHDIHITDELGRKLAARRIGDGIAGIGQFHVLVSGFTTDPGQVWIGIETDHGLWVEALISAGYRVFVVSPGTAARCQPGQPLHDALGAARGVLTNWCQTLSRIGR